MRTSDFFLTVAILSLSLDLNIRFRSEVSQEQCRSETRLSRIGACFCISKARILVYSSAITLISVEQRSRDYQLTEAKYDKRSSLSKFFICLVFMTLCCFVTPPRNFRTAYIW